MENISQHTSPLAFESATLTTWNRPFIWMMRGFLLTLLALTGLYGLAPLNYQSPQPQYFACLLLLLMFWIGWMISLIALLVFLLGWLLPKP